MKNLKDIIQSLIRRHKHEAIVLSRHLPNVDQDEITKEIEEISEIVQRTIAEQEANEPREHINLPIEEYFRQQGFPVEKTKFNLWSKLKPGDLVEIDGYDYMYLGINPNGGPGKPGIAEPKFTTPAPINPGVVFYLRPEQVSDLYPMDIFREKIAYDVNTTQTKVAFINGTNINHFGHLSKEEWRIGKYFEKYRKRYEKMLTLKQP